MQKAVKRMRRQVRNWEKIFAKYASDKRVLSKIHQKNPLKTQKQENEQPKKKWAKHLNIHLTKMIYGGK